MASLKCGNCASEVSRDMEYCPNCGESIGEDEPFKETTTREETAQKSDEQANNDDVPWKQYGDVERGSSSKTDSEGYSLTTLVVAAAITLVVGYFVGHAVAMSSAEAAVIDCYNTHISGLGTSGQGFATCLQNEGMSINIQG